MDGCFLFWMAAARGGVGWSFVSWLRGNTKRQQDMSWWFCSHSLVEFPTTLGNMIHSPLAGAHIDPAGLSLLYTHMYIHQYIQVNVNDYLFKHFSEIAWLLWSSWSNRKKFEPPKWAASAGDEEILGSRRWFRILVMLVVILMTTMTVLWVRLSDCWQVLSKRVSEVWGRNWSLFRESDLNGARQTWEDELQLPKKFICNLNMSSGKNELESIIFMWVTWWNFLS